MNFINVQSTRHHTLLTETDEPNTHTEYPNATAKLGNYSYSPKRRKHKMGHE